jgi:hypothetical protein
VDPCCSTILSCTWQSLLPICLALPLALLILISKQKLCCLIFLYFLSSFLAQGLCTCLFSPLHCPSPGWVVKHSLALISPSSLLPQLLQVMLPHLLRWPLITLFYAVCLPLTVIPTQT